MRSSKEFRALARYRLAGKWGTSILVTFVAALLGGTENRTPDFTTILDMGDLPEQVRGGLEPLFAHPLVSSLVTGFLAAGLMIGLALFVLGSAVELGHHRYYIGLAVGETPDFALLFSRFSVFLKALGLRLYMALFIILWGLLLLIPGIVASYRYAMAPYLMAQYPEKGIRECMEDSKALMPGHKGRLFLLDLSFIGWIFLSLFTAGLGMLWLNPYMAAARAAFYLERTGQLPDLSREGGGQEPQPQA